MEPVTAIAAACKMAAGHFRAACHRAILRAKTPPLRSRWARAWSVIRHVPGLVRDFRRAESIRGRIWGGREDRTRCDSPQSAGRNDQRRWSPREPARAARQTPARIREAPVTEDRPWVDQGPSPAERARDARQSAARPPRVVPPGVLPPRVSGRTRGGRWDDQGRPPPSRGGRAPR